MAANPATLSSSFDSDMSMSGSAAASAHSANTQDPFPTSNNMPSPPHHNSQSYDYDATDDDTDMSSDGGVQLEMTSSHAHYLNAEMDLVDAEVMGPSNLAAISMTSYSPEVHQTDDSVEAFSSQDHSNSESSFHAPSWMDGPLQIINGNPQASSITDSMSQLSQQLQHIQNGQEQGELAASAGQHGMPQGQVNGTADFLTSPPSSLSFTAMQLQLDTASYFSNVLSAGPMSPDSGLPSHILSFVSGSALPMVHQSIDFIVTSPSAMGVTPNVESPDGDSTLNHSAWEVVGPDDEHHLGTWDTEDVSQANHLQVEEQRNHTLVDFLYSWGASATRSNSKKRTRGPNLINLDRLRVERPTQVRRSDLRGDRCDIQGIDWTKLDVTRREARAMRNHYYRNYTNMRPPPYHNMLVEQSIISDTQSFFKFQQMDFRPKIGLAHFQLRNLLACTSKNSVHYAGESKVYDINPVFNQKAVRLDLTDPIVQPPNAPPFMGIQVSTLAADHNILVAGGFSGEYAMVGLDTTFGTPHVEGLVTQDPNPITNHVQIHLSRQSGLPQATFASNDGELRILDCTTNKFVSQHKYSFPVNCSAISPDHRLRVMVGDTRHVMICNAETGAVLQELGGHVDFGFACAWADNGWHVATGNQDKLIKIWDARMWTDSYGVGKPLQTIAATMAGARSLKFSPLGSGKRVLVAAESSDVVSVIDAETYTSKQTLDFYGEVCGVDFTPDGQRLFVGIYDPLRGGIMEFERCGFGQYRSFTNVSKYGNMKSKMETELDEKAAGYDWRPQARMVAEDPRSIRTSTHESRKSALNHDMDPF